MINETGCVRLIETGSTFTQFSIRIFNALGQLVEVLVDRHMGPGVHSVNWQANVHAGGVYFYQLETADFLKTRKLLLLK
jgi:hypothetical protein